MELSSGKIHATAINYSFCKRKSSELWQMFGELSNVSYLRNYTHYHLLVSIYVGYSESNLWCAVHKTCTEKNKFIIYKNMYICKILLNVIAAGFEALVVLGNKLLYACVKGFCHL
jgi:uncharacterized membrane protein